MKNLFKIVNVIVFFTTMAVLFSCIFCVSAEPKVINGPDLSVTITEIDENGINVDIGFINNPGVGAMTFTIMYDTNCFKVTGDYNDYGYFYTPVGITGYGVVDHPDRGYVSFVQADGGNTNLFKGTGTFLTLQFGITKKEPGKHWFKIANINPTQRGEDLEGCFADFEHNKFIATAKNDYYYIPATEDNPCTNHDYELVNKVEPSCTADGYSLYRCTICEKTKKSNMVQATGHDFDTNWTVDREGGNGVTKIISRHCKNCGERTDIRYLSETQSMPEEVEEENQSSSGNSSNTNSETTGNNSSSVTSSKDIDSKTSISSKDTNNTTSSNSKDTGSKNTSSETENNSKNTSNGTGSNSKGASNKSGNNSKVTNSETGNSNKETTSTSGGNSKDTGSVTGANDKDISTVTDGNIEDKTIIQSLIDSFLSDEFSDDDFASADDVIESVKHGDYFYYGGVKLPNKAKTIGDLIAKAFVYLFGAGDRKGIIAIVLNAIMGAFQ